MWLTPTYHALRLHRPHLGATALPVEITSSTSIPGGSSAVTATASKQNGTLAVTLINRHWDQPASVRITGVGHTGQAAGELLTAESPRAGNSASEPDRVAPVRLAVGRDGTEYRVELPPHSLATVVLH